MEARLVREDGRGHEMYELDGKYYIVYVAKNSWQFQSCLPADNPPEGRWISGWTDKGLKYVAKGRSKASATSLWNRYYG